jgi:hypothetical protein
MAKTVLDFHDIYNKGLTIDVELNRVIVEATEKKIALVEIIHGKGSGQLKKGVLQFLAKPEIKSNTTGLYNMVLQLLPLVYLLSLKSICASSLDKMLI